MSAYFPSSRVLNGFVTVVAIVLIFAPANPKATQHASPTETSTASVIISWTAPGDDDDQGTASQYDLRYSTQMITPENWDAATQVANEPVPQPAYTQQQMTVSGLTDNVVYYFAIKAADEVPNWSPLSNVVIVDLCRPEAVSDLNAFMGVNEGEITMAWTATGDDGSEGTASEYYLLYDTLAITQDNWKNAYRWEDPPAPSPSGQAQVWTLSDLVPGTEYYLAIVVVDDAGNESMLSNVVTAVARFELAADYHNPSAIDDLEADTGLSVGELDLSWTATGDDSVSGTASLYVILYDTLEITPSTWANANVWPNPPTPLASGQPQSFTLSELIPGKEYFVAVIVLDDVGNQSPLSNVTTGVARPVGVGILEDDESDATPASFTLSQNYPNPFNPSTTINYTIKEPSWVSLTVYNSLGQRIAVLVEQHQASGAYRAYWDGLDEYNMRVASGIYLYRLQAGHFSKTKKMVLMR